MCSVWDDNGHFSYHTVGNDLAETALAGWALLLRLMVRRGIRPVQRTRPPWLGTLDRTTLKLLDGLARRDGAHIRPAFAIGAGRGATTGGSK